MAHLNNGSKSNFCTPQSKPPIQHMQGLWGQRQACVRFPLSAERVVAALAAVFDEDEDDDCDVDMGVLHNLDNKMQDAVSPTDANKFYASRETFSPCQKCQNHGCSATCHHLASAPVFTAKAQPQNKLCEWGNHHSIIGAAKKRGLSLQLNTTLTFSPVV